MPVENRDYYKILEVEPTADGKGIQAAYKWMLLKLQTEMDQHLDPDAAQRMKDVNVAYGILSNPAKRALYDYQCASRNAGRTAWEESARRRVDQEMARQRAERVEQKLRAWRQRSNSFRQSQEKA